MPGRFVISFVLALGAMPAAGAADPPPLTAREKGDLAIQSRAILRRYCGECHGGGPGPSMLSVLDYKQLVAKGAAEGPIPFVDIDGPSRSQVMEFVEDGSMPPGGRPRPTPQEVETLKRWVAARAPSYPRAFDDATTLDVMLTDWEAQRATDRPHLRYLSFAHLVTDDKLPNLGQATQQLQKALVAASGMSITPGPVDDSATLYRVDLRDLKWDALDLFDNVVAGVAKPDTFPMIPFDLLLLENPHAVSVPANSPSAGRLRSFLAATRPLRPIPFLRADWVSEVLAPNAPLAADLRSMVDLADAQKKGANDPCGPTVRPFAGLKPVPAPLTAWYAGSVSTVPEPFKLTAEVRSDGKPTSAVELGEPFRIHVSADRDVKFVLLNVLSEGDVRVQSPAGGTVLPKRMIRELAPGEGGAFKISSNITGAETFTEHFVLIATDRDLPAVRIVRSRHDPGLECTRKGRGPVWRIVTQDPTTGEFDPARTVRKVIPLSVTRKKT